jgi:hypothetical protein
LVEKWIWLEINALAKDEFQAIEPLNLRAGMRLRRFQNLVDLNSASWNRIANWLRRIKHLQEAAWA